MFLNIGRGGGESGIEVSNYAAGANVCEGVRGGGVKGPDFWL